MNDDTLKSRNDIIQERDALLTTLRKIQGVCTATGSPLMTYETVRETLKNINWDVLNRAKADYNTDTDKLIAARETIDLLRENLGELVNPQNAGLQYDGDWGEYTCNHCEMTTGAGFEEFPHKPECPIERGRKLYKETNPNGK